MPEKQQNYTEDLKVKGKVDNERRNERKVFFFIIHTVEILSSHSKQSAKDSLTQNFCFCPFLSGNEPHLLQEIHK